MKLKKDKKDKEEKIKEAVEEKIEEKPEIIVAPRCTMERVENEETGGVDVVYSKNCGSDKIRDVAGKVALDGVRFRPEPEEKKTTEKTKEEIKKEFDDKVSACKIRSEEKEKPAETIEELEKRLVDLKQQRDSIETPAVPEQIEKPAED